MLTKLNTEIRRRLIDSNGSIFNSAGIVFANNTFGVLAQLLLAVFISRSFGAYGKGLFSLILTGSTVSAVVLSCGINNALVYFVKKGRLLSKSAILIAITMAILIALICFLGLTLLKDWLWNLVLEDLEFNLQYALLASLHAGAAFLNLFVISYCLAVRKLKTHLLAAGVFPLFAISATLIFWTMTRTDILSTLTFYVSLNLSLIISIAVVVWLQSDATGSNGKGPSPREILSYGLRGHVGTIGTGILTRLDIFVIAILLSPSAVGVYSIAKLIHQLLMMVPNAMNGLLFGHYCEREPADALRLNSYVSSRLLIFLVVIALPLLFAGPILIPFVFGPEFAQVQTPLIFLSVGAIFLGASSPYNALFLALGTPEKSSLVGLVGGITRVTLSTLLTAAYSINGTAAGNAIASCLTFALRKILSARIAAGN